MITNYPEYPKEEIDWLREFYPTHSLAETREAFNEHFGVEYTKNQICHRLHKFGIKNNRNTKFKKGHVSWNKGMSYETERPELYIKKVNELKRHNFYENTNFIPRPLGTEVKKSNGRVYVKVGNKKWKLKQRYLYEQAHNVKLRKDELIIFLDGNKDNFDIDNLLKVNTAVMFRVAQAHGYTTDQMLTRAYVYIAEIKQAIKERNEDGKN